MNMMDLRKYAAEAVGTFVLVLGGLGSAILAGPKIGNVGIGLAFGLALLAMVYAIGPISGCHINPAVTLEVLVARKITIRDAVGYWCGQIVGAIVATAVLLLIVSSRGFPAAMTRPRRGSVPTAMTPTHPHMWPWDRSSWPKSC